MVVCQILCGTHILRLQIAILCNLMLWYKASDLMNVLGVKGTRTKELLRALLADEKLVDDGATKGKRYKKAD